VEEHAHAPLLAELLREGANQLGSDLRVERILVERKHADAVGAHLLELGLDPTQRRPAIAVDEAEIHALLGQLVRRSQAEAARSAEDQRPVLGGESRVQAHFREPPARRRRARP
jgi:hypothetical protein